MASVFLVAAIFGGGVLVIQVVLSMFGLGGDHDAAHAGGHMEHGGSGHALTHGQGGAHADQHHSHAGEGLNLLSVRGLAAGMAFFGLAGLGGMKAHWPAPIAAVGGAIVGFLAMIGVAVLYRSMLRLESDGSVEMANAIGQPATVYIPIPGDGITPGKVMVAVQGRTLECDAVTSGVNSTALPTGTAVTVVDLRDGNLLEVVPTPNPLA